MWTKLSEAQKAKREKGLFKHFHSKNISPFFVHFWQQKTKKLHVNLLSPVQDIFSWGSIGYQKLIMLLITSGHPSLQGWVPEGIPNIFLSPKFEVDRECYDWSRQHCQRVFSGRPNQINTCTWSKNLPATLKSHYTGHWIRPMSPKTVEYPSDIPSIFKTSCMFQKKWGITNKTAFWLLNYAKMFVLGH